MQLVQRPKAEATRLAHRDGRTPVVTLGAVVLTSESNRVLRTIARPCCHRLSHSLSSTSPRVGSIKDSWKRSSDRLRGTRLSLRSLWAAANKTALRWTCFSRRRRSPAPPFHRDPAPGGVGAGGGHGTDLGDTAYQDPRRRRKPAQGMAVGVDQGRAALGTVDRVGLQAARPARRAGEQQRPGCAAGLRRRPLRQGGPDLSCIAIGDIR